MIKKILSLPDRIGKCKHPKAVFLLIYTVLFALISAAVFFWYFFNGRATVWISDGWDQHLKALVYYSKYLRSIAKTLLLDHRLVIPSWDFCLGEGNDILQTLHYYVIGDPFTFLSALVPSRFMYIFYEAMILLRIYLAGLSFSFMCSRTGKRGRYAILAGALTYVFSYWVIKAVIHPYFLNPMIYFPLMVVGLEKIFKKEKPFLYIVSLFLCAISNFYFFFMIVIITVIYVAARLISLYRFKLTKWLADGGRIILYSLLACAMAAVILLPILSTFLSDSRMGVDNAFHLLYPKSYYYLLPGIFVSAGSKYWMCMGFAAPVLPAVFLLFSEKKKNILLKSLFLICVILCLFPVFGQVFNGFSYMCNRWSWAFALLAAYILVTMWPRLMHLTRKDFKKLFIGTALYLLLCLLLKQSRTVPAFIALGLIFIFLFTVLPGKDALFNAKRRQQITLVIIAVSVFMCGFSRFSAEGENYTQYAKDVSQVKNELKKNAVSAVLSAAKADNAQGFWRYSPYTGKSMARNAGALKGLSSTQYYWSLSNPYISQFRTETELLETSTYSYYGYDHRAALDALACVRYYVAPKGTKIVPYGFTFVKTVNVKKIDAKELTEQLKKELQTPDITSTQINKVTSIGIYDVYRNDNYLPLAYAYDKCIDYSEWDKLDAVNKQQALLQGAVVSDYNGNVDKIQPVHEAHTLDYTVKIDKNSVTQTDKGFVVTSPDSKVTLEFEGVNESETYLSISGLNFTGTSEYDLYFGDSDVDPLNLYNKVVWDNLRQNTRDQIKENHRFWIPPTDTQIKIKCAGKTKTLDYWTNDYSYYNGRHDFTANLGYNEDAPASITLTFEKAGIYTFDSITLRALPMADFSSQIDELKDGVTGQPTISTDRVKGTFTADKNKMLCFSIPYSSGWRALVDGKEVKLYQINVKSMGVELDKGTHTVELIYSTPLYKYGIYLSIGAFIVFIIFFIFGRKKAKPPTLESQAEKS